MSGGRPRPKGAAAPRAAGESGPLRCRLSISAHGSPSSSDRPVVRSRQAAATGGPRERSTRRRIAASNARHRRLGRLEHEVAAVAHDPAADLRRLSRRRQRLPRRPLRQDDTDSRCGRAGRPVSPARRVRQGNLDGTRHRGGPRRIGRETLETSAPRVDALGAADLRGCPSAMRCRRRGPRSRPRCGGRAGLLPSSARGGYVRARRAGPGTRRTLPGPPHVPTAVAGATRAPHTHAYIAGARPSRTRPEGIA